MVKKLKMIARWGCGILCASVCTLVILKSDKIIDKLIGPSLFVNAVMMPVLANIFLFGYSRRVVQGLGLMIKQKTTKIN